MDMHVMLCKMVMSKLNYERNASYSCLTKLRHYPILKAIIPNILDYTAHAILSGIIELVQSQCKIDLNAIFKNLTSNGGVNII